MMCCLALWAACWLRPRQRIPIRYQSITSPEFLVDIAAGLALALLAIPCALAGYQIMFRLQSCQPGECHASAHAYYFAGRCRGRELLCDECRDQSRKCHSGKSLCSLKTIPPTTYMPSANWSCNAHQFFGSLFNLSVYNSQKASQSISLDQFSQDTNTTTATLITNLSNYVMTLLAALLCVSSLCAWPCSICILS